MQEIVRVVHLISLERSPLNEQIRVLTCSSQLERVVERSSRISWTDGRACSGVLVRFFTNFLAMKVGRTFFAGNAHL